MTMQWSCELALSSHLHCLNYCLCCYLALSCPGGEPLRCFLLNVLIISSDVFYCESKSPETAWQHPSLLRWCVHSWSSPVVFLVWLAPWQSPALVSDLLADSSCWIGAKGSLSAGYLAWQFLCPVYVLHLHFCYFFVHSKTYSANSMLLIRHTSTRLITVFFLHSFHIIWP